MIFEKDESRYHPVEEISIDRLRDIILAKHLESCYIKLKAQKPKRDIYLHGNKEFIVGQLETSPLIIHGNRDEEAVLIQELEKITLLKLEKVF